jgi:hypothetical protein
MKEWRGEENLLLLFGVIECRDAVLQITELWRSLETFCSPAPVQQEARHNLPSALPVGLYRGGVYVLLLLSCISFCPLSGTPLWAVPQRAKETIGAPRGYCSGSSGHG